jgi:hypothetical protein
MIIYIAWKCLYTGYLLKFYAIKFSQHRMMIIYITWKCLYKGCLLKFYTIKFSQHRIIIYITWKCLYTGCLLKFYTIKFSQHRIIIICITWKCRSQGNSLNVLFVGTETAYTIETHTHTHTQSSAVTLKTRLDSATLHASWRKSHASLAACLLLFRRYWQARAACPWKHYIVLLPL